MGFLEHIVMTTEIVERRFPDQSFSLTSANFRVDGLRLQWIASKLKSAVDLWLNDYTIADKGFSVANGEEAAITTIKRALGALHTHLASNMFLAGYSVTLAVLYYDDSPAQLQQGISQGEADSITSTRRSCVWAACDT